MVDPLSRFDYLKEIITGIHEKKTKAVSNSIHEHRTYKMLYKGYTLMTRDDRYVISQNDDKDEVCTLCIEKIDKGYMLKRKCCNACYHPRCFHTMLGHENFNRSCPNCRNPISWGETDGVFWSTKKEREVVVLQEW